MLHLYFDEGATQRIRDNTDPKVGSPDRFEVPVSGGEVQALRYLWNDDPAFTYSHIRVSGFQDSGLIRLQYALDEGGSPGVFQDWIVLEDGPYTTPYPIWVKVTFAPAESVTPALYVDIYHRIQAIEKPA